MLVVPLLVLVVLRRSRHSVITRCVISLRVMTVLLKYYAFGWVAVGVLSILAYLVRMTLCVFKFSMRRLRVVVLCMTE